MIPLRPRNHTITTTTTSTSLSGLLILRALRLEDCTNANGHVPHFWRQTQAIWRVRFAQDLFELVSEEQALSGCAR
eukprot:2709689-Rhodomonas_salina.2